MKTFERQESSILQGSDTDTELMDAAARVVGANQQFQTYQIPVGTSPTPLAIQPTGFITIINLGTQDIFIGNAQVSLISGFLLAGVKGKAIKIKGNGDVYAIAAVASSVAIAINAEVDVAN